MSDYLIKEERLLLDLLKNALNKTNDNTDITDIDWDLFFKIAEKHAVLSLLYDYLQDIGIPDNLVELLNVKSKITVQQSYHLTFLSRALEELLESNGVFCVVLKGTCASAKYPVPELRKSGDVDLLICPEDLQKASEILIKEGIVETENQHANHHVSFLTKDGIGVELHTMIAEPFDNNEINRYLDKLVKECRFHSCIKETMGIPLKTLDDGFFAYQLLLHMLQHFLRAGFGLKLLCDWLVFWNNEVLEQSKTDYLRLVNESGLKGFSDIITAVCVYELGLEEDKIRFMFSDNNIPKKHIAKAFVKEIIEAEEFGHSNNERMVIMRGTGIIDYIREFHHQMRLNYPKASKLFLLWPFLWVITFVRFILNNKKIRNVSTKDVLKTAHSRSKLMESMNLFK